VGDFDGHGFLGFLGDFFLAEEDFDRFRVVVADELGIPQLVDKRLTTAREIVGVEERACASRNAESNASLARTFSFWRLAQCWPSSRLRLGVR
jgi:hypothetical protein